MLSFYRNLVLSCQQSDRQICCTVPSVRSYRCDNYKILKEMSPNPVTIRLLDPPLHEFLPSQKNTGLINLLAKNMKISAKEIKNRIIDLFEINPMLGHRGCRLAISFPEITEMQVEAIFSACAKLLNKGFKPNPEIMIPLVSTIGEFDNQK